MRTRSATPTCINVARERDREGPLIAGLLLAALPLAAPAHPDEPPWGLPGEEQCLDCHFSEAPVEESSALTLAGTPERLQANQSYRLRVHFAPAAVQRAGLLIAATGPHGPVGTFRAVDDRVEAKGARARSTLSGSTLTGLDSTTWQLEWRAPRELRGPVTFVVTANAANDDASPLGDVIHGLQVEVP